MRHLQACSTQQRISHVFCATSPGPCLRFHSGPCKPSSSPGTFTGAASDTFSSPHIITTSRSLSASSPFPSTCPVPTPGPLFSYFGTASRTYTRCSCPPWRPRSLPDNHGHSPVPHSRSHSHTLDLHGYRDDASRLWRVHCAHNLVSSAWPRARSHLRPDCDCRNTLHNSGVCVRAVGCVKGAFFWEEWGPWPAPGEVGIGQGGRFLNSCPRMLVSGWRDVTPFTRSGMIISEYPGSTGCNTMDEPTSRILRTNPCLCKEMARIPVNCRPETSSRSSKDSTQDEFRFLRYDSPTGGRRLILDRTRKGSTRPATP